MKMLILATTNVASRCWNLMIMKCHKLTVRWFSATELRLISAILFFGSAVSYSQTCAPSTTTSGSSTTLIFTATGTCSWTVPAGVSSITVECWGGGGGGGGAKSGGGSAAAGGGGGGGYSRQVYSVSSGQAYSILVGTGGGGGAASGSTGGNGGSSTFSGNSYSLTATGGNGGAGAGNNIGGNGGNGGTGTSSGGAGQKGVVASQDFGGSGGGAAGPSGNGGAGNTSVGNNPMVGGTGNSPGGNGGNGGKTYYAAANPSGGGAPGGGGGGGAASGTGTKAGSGGGRGEIRITYVIAPPSITTGSITGSPFCSGSVVSVPYTITGAFNAGNIFTAQLSNASGSFTSPVNIGSVSSVNGGTISATLPSGISGTGYRIRVISSNPVIVGTDNGVDFTINTAIQPSNIQVSSVSVCSGASVTVTRQGGIGTAQDRWWMSRDGIQWNEFSDFYTGQASWTRQLNTPGTYQVYYHPYDNACGWSNWGLGIYSTTITVIDPPSATLTSNSTTVCLGNTVSLDGTVTATGAWTINLSSGGSVSGTGNGTWSTTVTPSATTTYSISSVTGACTGTGTGSSTVTLPASSGSLAGNESATCPVKGNNWIHFYNPSTGNYIGAIHPNNQDLGNVTMTSYAGSPQVMYACADPANTLYHTAYMGRSWVIRSANVSYSNGQNFPSTATVKLPFSNAELTALNNYANTATPGNPNDGGTAVPVTLANMMLTKYSGAVEDNSADNCAGGGVIRAVTASPGSGTSPQGISGASYKDFTIQQFSEFFLHKSPGNSPLPVELTNFSATCDNSVKIQWSTASEQNSDKFILEKSNDLNAWRWVGNQQAAGNSSLSIEYEMTDDERSGEIVYYRLRQVDLNGTEKVYGPVSLLCSEFHRLLKIYPNPAENKFVVEVNNEEDNYQGKIIITDMAGKIVDDRRIMLSKGSHHLYYENLHFDTGTYLLKIESESGNYPPQRLIIR